MDPPRGGAAGTPLMNRVKSRGQASDGFDAIPPAILAALDDYFRDPRAGLPVAVAPAGTRFQQRVWRALQAIPVGQTRSYGDLARDLNTSARAIGGACRANPCLIAIPCHRVVAKVGLGGFGGDVEGRLLAVKRWLLHHEGCIDASAATARPMK